MRPSLPTLLLWAAALLLALLVWMTVTGRLGQSRHGYGGGPAPAAAAPAG